MSSTPRLSDQSSAIATQGLSLSGSEAPPRAPIASALSAISLTPTVAVDGSVSFSFSFEPSIEIPIVARRVQAPQGITQPLQLSADSWSKGILDGRRPIITPSEEAGGEPSVSYRGINASIYISAVLQAHLLRLSGSIQRPIKEKLAAFESNNGSYEFLATLIVEELISSEAPIVQQNIPRFLHPHLTKLQALRDSFQKLSPANQILVRTRLHQMGPDLDAKSQEVLLAARDIIGSMAQEDGAIRNGAAAGVESYLATHPVDQIEEIVIEEIEPVQVIQPLGPPLPLIDAETVNVIDVSGLHKIPTPIPWDRINASIEQAERDMGRPLAFTDLLTHFDEVNRLAPLPADAIAAARRAHAVQTTLIAKNRNMLRGYIDYLNRAVLRTNYYNVSYGDIDPIRNPAGWQRDLAIRNENIAKQEAYRVQHFHKLKTLAKACILYYRNVEIPPNKKRESLEALVQAGYNPDRTDDRLTQGNCDPGKMAAGVKAFQILEPAGDDVAGFFYNIVERHKEDLFVALDRGGHSENMLAYVATRVGKVIGLEVTPERGIDPHRDDYPPRDGQRYYRSEEDLVKIFHTLFTGRPNEAVAMIYAKVTEALPEEREMIGKKIEDIIRVAVNEGRLTHEEAARRLDLYRTAVMPTLGSALVYTIHEAGVKFLLSQYGIIKSPQAIVDETSDFRTYFEQAKVAVEHSDFPRFLDMPPSFPRTASISPSLAGYRDAYQAREARRAEILAINEARRAHVVDINFHRALIKTTLHTVSAVGAGVGFYFVDMLRRIDKDPVHGISDLLFEQQAAMVVALCMSTPQGEEQDLRNCPSYVSEAQKTALRQLSSQYHALRVEQQAAVMASLYKEAGPANSEARVVWAFFKNTAAALGNDPTLELAVRAAAKGIIAEETQKAIQLLTPLSAEIDEDQACLRGLINAAIFNLAGTEAEVARFAQIEKRLDQIEALLSRYTHPAIDQRDPDIQRILDKVFELENMWAQFDELSDDDKDIALRRTPPPEPFADVIAQLSPTHHQAVMVAPAPIGETTAAVIAAVTPLDAEHNADRDCFIRILNAAGVDVAQNAEGNYTFTPTTRIPIAAQAADIARFPEILNRMREIGPSLLQDGIDDYNLDILIIHYHLAILNGMFTHYQMLPNVTRHTVGTLVDVTPTAIEQATPLDAEHDADRAYLLALLTAAGIDVAHGEDGSLALNAENRLTFTQSARNPEPAVGLDAAGLFTIKRRLFALLRTLREDEVRSIDMNNAQIASIVARRSVLMQLFIHYAEALNPDVRAVVGIGSNPVLAVPVPVQINVEATGAAIAAATPLDAEHDADRACLIRLLNRAGVVVVPTAQGLFFNQFPTPAQAALADDIARFAAIQEDGGRIDLLQTALYHTQGADPNNADIQRMGHNVALLEQLMGYYNGLDPAVRATIGTGA